MQSFGLHFNRFLLFVIWGIQLAYLICQLYTSKEEHTHYFMLYNTWWVSLVNSWCWGRNSPGKLDQDTGLWRISSYVHVILNTMRPSQVGRHFPDIFKCIFMNENAWTSITISLNFVPKSPVHTIPALVQIMAWRRSGDKPLPEPKPVSLLTHICVTRPQWVKSSASIKYVGYTILCRMRPLANYIFFQSRGGGEYVNIFIYLLTTTRLINSK